jgi:hypothetical protein
VDAWHPSLDRLDALDPSVIGPSHGETGDGSLIETTRAYLEALRARVAELKSEGKTLEETSETVVAEFRERYPDWRGSAAAAVGVAYREAG